MFLALAFVFGLGYCWVGRDLAKNHDIIRMGILGQISVFVISLYAVTLAHPRLAWPYLLPGLVDLVLDEAASPRDGGSGLGGCADWEEAGRREILV